MYSNTQCSLSRLKEKPLYASIYDKKKFIEWYFVGYQNYKILRTMQEKMKTVDFKELLKNNGNSQRVSNWQWKKKLFTFHECEKSPGLHTKS